jgi:hypothetical protein
MGDVRGAAYRHAGLDREPLNIRTGVAQPRQAGCGPGCFGSTTNLAKVEIDPPGRKVHLHRARTGDRPDHDGIAGPPPRPDPDGEGEWATFEAPHTDTQASIENH